MKVDGHVLGVWDIRLEATCNMDPKYHAGLLAERICYLTTRLDMQPGGVGSALARFFLQRVVSRGGFYNNAAITSRQKQSKDRSDSRRLVCS